MSAIHLDTAVSTAIESAIETHTLGDDTIWSIGTMMHPEHGMVGTLALWMRGGFLGSWNCQVIIIVNPHEWAVEPEKADPYIQNALEELRKMRSTQLAEQPGGPGLLGSSN